MMKPTIGSIVHFYNYALPAHANNHIGFGPYAAIITQVFNEHYVNLKVLPYGDAWDEGSVLEHDHGARAETAPHRYWVWPPQDQS